MNTNEIIGALVTDMYSYALENRQYSMIHFINNRLSKPDMNQVERITELMEQHELIEPSEFGAGYKLTHKGKTIHEHGGWLIHLKAINNPNPIRVSDVSKSKSNRIPNLINLGLLGVAIVGLFFQYQTNGELKAKITKLEMEKMQLDDTINVRGIRLMDNRLHYSKEIDKLHKQIDSLTRPKIVIKYPMVLPKTPAK